MVYKMVSDKEIEKVVEELESHTSRNMGQFTFSINNIPVIIQKRSSENYIMYFFENKKDMFGLDIKLATKFKKFKKDELIAFLKGE